MNDGLDGEILSLIVSACKDAHLKALEVGSVLIAEDEDCKRFIFEVDKFGNKKKIKEIEPNITYPKDSKFEIPK
jgi:hypothetical protein